MPKAISASSTGPARPRAIGCEGAGGCVMASQDRQENFSRTCWRTNQLAGTRSSDSVMSSPSLCRRPAQHGHAEQLGRCAGSGRRAGLRRVKASTGVAGAAISSAARIAAMVSSMSSSASSNWPILAPASEDCPNASRRAFASWKRNRSSSRASTMRSNRALATAASAVSLAVRSTSLAARSARIIACAAARSLGSDSVGVLTQRENHGSDALGSDQRRCTQLVRRYPAACGRQVCRGERQSIPSSR